MIDANEDSEHLFGDNGQRKKIRNAVFLGAGTIPVDAYKIRNSLYLTVGNILGRFCEGCFFCVRVSNLCEHHRKLQLTSSCKRIAVREML